MNRKGASDDRDDLTLGDLLYSDRSGAGAVIPERDWVGLIESMAAGDQHALRALFQRTHRIVFTLVMRICRNREMAEELTLDVFHDVWRRSGEYQPDGGSVVGWIMNQARSRAIDRLRFEQRQKRTPPDGGHEDAAVDNTVEHLQRRGLLQGVLTVLTPEERLVIETSFFSELTYAETAARLDQPLGTVKTRVRSALAKLRKALDGGTP